MNARITTEEKLQNEKKLREKMYTKIEKIYGAGARSKGLIVHLINSFIYPQEPIFKFSVADKRKLICALSGCSLELVGSKTKKGNEVPERYIALGSKESNKIMSALAVEELKKFAEANKIVSAKESKKAIPVKEKPSSPQLSKQMAIERVKQTNLSRIDGWKERLSKQGSPRVMGDLIEGVENGKRLTGKVFELSSLASLKEKLEAEGK